jgi:hypothetical protein
MCLKCDKKYKLTTANTNLTYHLKKCHQLVETTVPLNQPSVSKFLEVKPRISKERSDVITKLISNWITEDLVEPSKVMGSGFQKLMSALQTGYEVPHRTTFMRTIIPKEYKDLKDKIQFLMAESTLKKSVTADLWTDNYRKKHYLGLTVHFIHKWRLYSFVLATKEFKVSKTAENIRLHVSKLAADWKIIAPYIVTDNGSAEVLAVKLLDWTGFRCTAHVLNLVVHDIIHHETMGELKVLVEKFRKIVHHFVYKGSRYEDLQARLFQIPSDELLEELFENGDEDTDIVNSRTTLKKDVPTRWNSILTMIE